ncbi:MAG TPA: hypothetical protein PLN69_07880 [bacterium]|nr:hypothetical protein [bacterium]
MADSAQVRIALVGAGGMSFGPVMSYDVIRSEKLEGSTLVLVDFDEEKLEVARAATERLNEACGSRINVEAETDTARGVEGADFVIVSAEKNRWAGWKQDYEVPVKYGSAQDMGENGGPGGLFHSLRSINNMLDICRLVEQNAGDAFLMNLTNPMSRVTLAINRATSLRNVGLCHEFFGGHLRLALFLMKPMERVLAKASGINHFTWFYEITDAETGEDLYPALRRAVKYFPFPHSKLIRKCFNEFGLYPTSTDSHIGEYLPPEYHDGQPFVKYHDFFRTEGELRFHLTRYYGDGILPFPARLLPRSWEEVIPILEALATGDEAARFNAVNVPNSGYVPNLPEGAIVEVSSGVEGNSLCPDTVPEIHESLAGLMRTQIEIQDRIVDSALKKDPDLAFEALVMDPLSPTESDCRKIFDELMDLQRYHLPFE